MTFPSDDQPFRTGRTRQPDESNTPQDEAPRFTEDDLWSADDGPSDGAQASIATSGTDASAYDDALLDDVYAGEEAQEEVRGKRGQRARRVFWEVTQTLLLAAAIFFMVRGVAQNFRVEGPSMEPGLHDGQYLLVNKAVYFKINLGTLSKYIPFIDGDEGEDKFIFHAPQRGDVIVFRYPRDPSRDFIKRVIGVPGDTVSIKSGSVLVNGVEIEEKYLDESTRGDLEPTVVPDGSYFVLGDNRSNSSDSRSWGFVPEENIIGKAMFSYWPLSEIGGVGNTKIDLGFIKIPLP